MRPRSRLARSAVRFSAAASRRLGLGEGSTIGGRAGLLLDPGLLRELGERRIVALVSGTNGKTTTTRLLCEALGGVGKVATSPAGANLPSGIVSALSSSPADTAVLEVDERYLPSVLDELDVSVVVLLNLARDQLDRMNEVTMLARRWREALATTTATVVANADDPLVVYAAQAASRSVYVGAGGLWRLDAHLCPACGEGIEFLEHSWSCRCGFARPSTVAELDGNVLLTTSGASLRVEPALPGRFNRANAVMAAVAATTCGVDLRDALAATCLVDDVAGRFVELSVGDTTARLLLAKNPAGWTELLGLLKDGDNPVVIAINARDADGHDPSWLYDVPFEQLQGRPVIACGERRLDLSVRLRHAGVERAIEDDALLALAAFPGRHVECIANYTAFQEIRKKSAARSAASRGRRVAFHAKERIVTPLAFAPPRETTGTGSDSALRVVVVHPDLLGTYGDGGNGRVLANRAAWRDLEVELVEAAFGGSMPKCGDLYLLGGGEDAPQTHSAQLLQDGSLRAAADNGAVVFAVCAGFQILGETFPDASGRLVPGVGLLDVTTEKGTGARAVGEVLTTSSSDSPIGAQVLNGFENHAGVTRLGSDVRPLGQVLVGHGNGLGGVDGAYSGRVIGTYLHGPVLARNPALCDALIALVTGRNLVPLSDEEEQALYNERVHAAKRPSWRGGSAKNLAKR